MEKKKSVVLKKKTNFQVLGQRVLIAPIETRIQEVTEGGIIIPEISREQLKREQSRILMMGEVISVGEEVTKVKLEDIVYVFPNQFEADIVIDSCTYLIYPERVLMGKVLID